MFEIGYPLSFLLFHEQLEQMRAFCKIEQIRRDCLQPKTEALQTPYPY